MRRLLLVATLAAALLSAAPAVGVTPPPTGTDVDYQLGGVRSSPANVGIVVRDREARPVPGRYNVCYVNGFQTQPGERVLWRRHRDLVLRDHGRHSFTRSHGLMTRRQAVAYARLLVRGAHRAGLAAGQKNLAGFDGTTVGYDFAVAEQCGRYDECGRYVRAYGERVLAIEYRRADFRRTCEQYGDRLAVVLRDRDLSPSGRRRWC